ncbi:MAG: twin-arginine translocase subunit TatB [Gammaproteobacteria bacterium]|uniref:Sec-independent protein translocase protein TatB n=1 Tax=Pseudomaricurvus alcaniphilus TaxID=1166482 RepID=UPI00140DA5A7|nr:twin-arginine translocase subunit TatB [Gammaproteobacteria bacterium]NHN38573.1 twin-arginine translocase subunit TatB [Pseudomaricurvus alcaniphilus]
MFDIGFFELLIIGVVALLVIGPERLPETLRTLALWWGRLKRGLQSTRTELEQHLGADDIRRQLHNEDIMRQLQATKRDMESLLDGDPGKSAAKPASAPSDTRPEADKSDAPATPAAAAKPASPASGGADDKGSA